MNRTAHVRKKYFTHVTVNSKAVKVNGREEEKGRERRERVISTVGMIWLFKMLLSFNCGISTIFCKIKQHIMFGAAQKFLKLLN